MTRTFFDRRVACKQIMRLAHVFLHIAAHILPLLTSKERATHFTTMHTGVKHQTGAHPRSNFTFQTLMCGRAAERPSVRARERALTR